MPYDLIYADTDPITSELTKRVPLARANKDHEGMQTEICSKLQPPDRSWLLLRPSDPWHREFQQMNAWTIETKKACLGIFSELLTWCYAWTGLAHSPRLMSNSWKFGILMILEGCHAASLFPLSIDNTEIFAESDRPCTAKLSNLSGSCAVTYGLNLWNHQMVMGMTKNDREKWDHRQLTMRYELETMLPYSLLLQEVRVCTTTEDFATCQDLFKNQAKPETYSDSDSPWNSQQLVFLHDSDLSLLSPHRPLDAALFDATAEDRASLCSSTLRFARCASSRVENNKIHYIYIMIILYIYIHMVGG